MSQLSAKVTRLEGERKVLADLLAQTVDVIKTLEPEGTDEAEAMAALTAYSEAALAGPVAPDKPDFFDSHPV